MDEKSFDSKKEIGEDGSAEAFSGGKSGVPRPGLRPKADAAAEAPRAGPARRGPIEIANLEHCKKESIAAIVPIEDEHESSFCYAVVSRHGKVGLYGGAFDFLLAYDVFFNRTGVVRRVRDVWITACAYLPDSRNLIIAASDKSMMIYDASALCHTPLYLVTGITNVITCLSYNFSPPTRDSIVPSYLAMGDDLGGLTTITFKQPRVGLFYKKYQDKLNSYFWIELQGPPHENFCKINFKRRIHSRAVRKVYHVKSNRSIISCTNDPEASVVIRHARGMTGPYVFRVPRGVTCFHYSETLSLLVTGGGDGHVRLWEPVVTSRASAVLPSQLTRIVDVATIAHLRVIVSLNKHAVLRFWDIFDHDCLQTIVLGFPSFAVLGKPIQFGFDSIHCGAPRATAQKLDSDNETPFGVEESLENVSDGNSSKSECLRSEFQKWNRPEIIISCCNHIAIVPMDVQRENEKTSYLPPPDKTHKPRKPSIWDESNQGFPNLKNDNERSADGNESPIDDSSRHIFLDHPPLEEMLKEIGLSGVMERNFVAEMGLEQDIHRKLGLQKIKKEKMQLPVSQGAPFTALDLHNHREIKFSLALPISDRMKSKSGLNHFTDPQEIMIYKSCFSMETPKSNYGTTSTTNKSNNHK